MGFSSQAGHVAFKNYGGGDTFPADFASTAIAMKTRTGSLGTSRELLVPDPEIGGGRDVVDAYLGAAVWSGDYEFYARFNALMSLLKAAFGTAVVKTPGGTSEVQTLTETGTISGGTFTITYSAQVTAAIAYNASAATIQAALEALSNIAPGDVEVTGGPVHTTPVVIRFLGTLLGVQPALTVDTTSLTGTTPGISVTETTAGTDYVGASVHTFYPSDAAQLPFLAIEERIGSGLEVFRYTDGVVNNLHFEVDANGYLMGTAGVIAKKQVAGASAVDPQGLFDNLPMVVGTNVTVTYNGVVLPAKTWSFDLNNNFEDDDFRLGSFYVGDLTPKRREVTMGVTIRPQDSGLWRQANYGLAAATQPGGITDKKDAVVTLATYETIPGSTPTLAYKMEFVIPKTALVPFNMEASGDDIIDHDIEIRLLRPEAHRKLLRVEVTTDKATVN